MSEDLVIQQSTIELAITPVMDIATAKARLAQFQEFVQGYLVENEDFGTIPGTPKPTLLKPGADKLCELYGLSDEYEIVVGYSQENWSMDPPLFDYTVRCTLKNKRNGMLVSTGLGSCNSYEGKYRWRVQNRKCPDCGKETILRSKKREGETEEPGWFCWAKKGGCGAQFPAGNVEIIGQATGKIANDDIATLKNTILKMAKKRAKVDAILSATRSSGIFTQDVEDFPDGSLNGKSSAPQAAGQKTPPPAQEFPHAVVEEVGVVEKLAKKKNKKDQAYFVFNFNGKSVFVWDDKLHPSVVSSEGLRIAAIIEKKGEYHSLVSFHVVKPEGLEEPPEDENPFPKE